MSLQELREEKVLIVDDEPHNRLLLDRILKGMVDLDYAESGSECLQKARNGFDLILLDIMMPDINGIDVCKKIKEDPETRHITIIFLSALHDSQIKAQGIEAGGVDFINKPFDKNELVSRIKTHLTLRRQTWKLQKYSRELEEQVAERTKTLDRHLQCEKIANAVLKLTLKPDISFKDALRFTLEEFMTLPWLECNRQGHIFLIQPGKDYMQLEASINILPEISQKCSKIKKGQCLCGQTWESGEPVFIPELDNESVDILSPPAKGGFLALPLKTETQDLGVLSVYTCPGLHLEQNDIQSLQAAVDALATFIIRTRQQEQLHKSETKYQTIFETTGSATVLVDETTGLVTTANHQFAKLYGLNKELLENKVHYLDFVHPEEKEIVKYYFQNRGTDPGIPDEYEFPFINSSGERRHVISNVARIPAMHSRVLSFLDITEKKEIEQELQKKTFYNPITELPNRSLFKNRLRKNLKSRDNDHEKDEYAVFILDLDRFKLINESLGRESGNELLMQVGRRLEKIVSPRETVGHFHADEFALMIRIDDVAEAALFAEKIKAELNSPFKIQDQDIFITACMGFTLLTPYSSSEAVIRDAEIALNRAKNTGSNSYVMADQFMNQEVREILDLETNLRKAEQNDELRLYYQPMIDLTSRQCIGFEALIRWQREDGLVPPNKFIPLAEETELIIPMGRWIMDRACRDLNDLQEISRQKIGMHVNFSGIQLRNKDLIPSLEETLKKTAVRPEQIIIELTESVIMANARQTIAILNKLKSMSFKLAIDDFGTGYSSLSYLQKFPINTVKIDRSFINNIQDQAGHALVKTIVDLARNLGLQTVAEGIEEPEQLDLLLEMGCKQAQGFFFAKPMPVGEAREYIKNTHTE